MITVSHFTDEKSEAQTANIISSVRMCVNPCLSPSQTLLFHPLPQVSCCDLLKPHWPCKGQGGTSTEPETSLRGHTEQAQPLFQVPTFPSLSLSLLCRLE